MSLATAEDIETEVSVENAFERDISDLDIPGFENEGSNEATIAIDVPALEEGEEDPDSPEAKAAAAAKKAAAGGEAGQTAAGTKVPKKLVFKVGDQNIELVEDAVVEHKVDGKQQPIALKELITNYAGKVAWEKRFSEVDQIRRKTAEEIGNHEAQKQKHSSLITDMHKAAKEGRLFDAVSSMIQMSGLKVNARDYLKNLRAAIVEDAQKLAGMTPEARAVHEEKEELEYLRSEGARLKQQQAQEQSQQAFQQRVGKAIERVGSTVEEYVQQRDFLLQQGPKLLGDKWDPNSVTPERVAEHIQDVRVYRTAQEGLTAADPKLIENETVWKQAAEILRANPDFTAADITDMYRKALAEKRSSTVSKKIAKTPTSTTATASTRRPRKANREDFTQFDERDLDW